MSKPATKAPGKAEAPASSVEIRRIENGYIVIAFPSGPARHVESAFGTLSAALHDAELRLAPPIRPAKKPAAKA